MRSCNPQGVLPSDITALAVGSYPTFSPLPASQSRHRRLFSVTLLHPHGHRAVNSCGALCCSDFPLPDSQAAIERTCKFFVHDAAVRFTLWLCHSLHLFFLRYELCLHDAAELVPAGIVTACISYFLGTNFGSTMRLLVLPYGIVTV